MGTPIHILFFIYDNFFYNCLITFRHYYYSKWIFLKPLIWPIFFYFYYIAKHWNSDWIKLSADCESSGAIRISLTWLVLLQSVSLKKSAAAAKKVSFSFQISILIWRLCTLRILDTYTPSQFDSIRILVPRDITKIVNKSIILKISRTFIFNNNKAEKLTNCLRKKIVPKIIRWPILTSVLNEFIDFSESIWIFLCFSRFCIYL